MRFDRLRRWLPWLLWLVAAAIAIPFGFTTTGAGSAPAVIDARVVALSAPRTPQRLRVAEVLVSPGQAVQAGQLLVRMDPVDVDADLAIARAKLGELELSARALEAKLRSEYDLTVSKLATNAERAALDASRIVAEEERDRSELAQLDQTLVQEQKLVTDQLASADRLNGMKLRKAALSGKVQEYRRAVEQARRSASGSNQRVGQWRKAGGKGRTDASSAPIVDRIAPVLAAVEGQRQEIRRIELMRNRLDLKAPFAGHIGEILLRAGESAADGPIITVVEDRTDRAIAYLDQTQTSWARVGDSAKLLPRDHDGPTLTGKVVALAPRIAELPVRFRHSPNVTEYARTVYIQLDAPAALAGQAFDAVFRHSPGVGR